MSNTFLGGAAEQIGKVAGKARDYAGGLVPGAGGAGEPPKGNLKYRAGETLDPRVGAPQALAMQSEAVGSPSGGAQTDNHRSAPLPIEYVHYSRIHVDMSDNFDTGTPSNGLAVRDGLLREAVLLHGFVASAQRALADKMASNSTAGKLVETAGALLGGNKKQADAGPEVFDPLIQRIQAAVANIAGASFTYQDVHQAGVDLHEVRSSFDALYKTALKPGGGGGDALSSFKKLPGVGALAGPVGDIPGYLFRAQGTYLSLVRAALDSYPRGIEDICSTFSIAAIRARAQPTWPIWFARRDAATPQYADAGAADNRGMLDDSLGSDLNGRDVLARQKRQERQFEQDRANQVTDAARLLDSEVPTADDCVYKPDVLAAMAVLQGKPPAPPPAAPGANLAQSPGNRIQADATMTRAFAAGVLDKEGAGLPGFIEVFVGQMSTASIQILDQLFLHLLSLGTGVSDGGKRLQAVQLATREALSQKLVGIAWGLLGGLLGLSAGGPGQNRQQGFSTSDVRDTAIDRAKNPSALLGDAKSLGQGAIANKAAEMATKLLTEHSAPLNKLIDFIADDLNQLLSEAFESSNADAALTMESFLGRLPLLHATLVRDSTFPVFRLVLGLFGDVDKLLVGAWNPIGGQDGALTKAGDAVGNSLDAADNAQNRLDDLDRRAPGLGENNDVGYGRDTNNDAVADKFSDYGRDAKNAPGTTLDELTKKRGHAGGGPSAQNAAGAARHSRPLNTTRVDGTPQRVTRGQIVAAENYDASHQVLVSGGAA